MSPTPLSCCIIAMDEEDRLGECLDSVAFCDEIVVVDSHSTDATRELAAARGARVIERDWPGHVAQKEFAVRSATHDWVLCVDADERVTPRLREEIQALRERNFPGHAGWRFPRLVNYLGTWVRHGTWYPDLQLRLFDRRRGRWGGNDPHDRVELEPGASAGRLAGDLVHVPYRSFADHLATIEQYTTIMARGMLARGRRAGLADLVVRPWVRFARFYFLRRGFLLGRKGLVLALLAGHYVRLKYMKLSVLGRGEALQ
jgi:glycosyltransferase involved in cell wall biosynthesis